MKIQQPKNGNATAVIILVIIILIIIMVSTIGKRPGSTFKPELKKIELDSIEHARNDSIANIERKDSLH